MTEPFYIVVKASLHAADASVFGLTNEEMGALASRYPGSNKEVVNGMLIKGNPLQIINSLGELGYRVVCSSGESDIVWTLKRDAMDVCHTFKTPVTVLDKMPPLSAVKNELLLKHEAPRKNNFQYSSDCNFKQQTDPAGRKDINRGSIVRTTGGRQSIVKVAETNGSTSNTNQVVPVEPQQKQLVEEPPKEKQYKLGGRPEDFAQYMPDTSSRIYIRNPESFDKEQQEQMHVILRTNEVSPNNPLATKRPNLQPLPLPLTPGTTIMTQPYPSVHQTIKEMDFERGLWYSAMLGDEEKVNKLLSKGHSPNEVDPSGYTALHYAAKNGHTDIVRGLIAAGANVNLQTKAGCATALHRAAGAGKTAICQLLIQAGANPMVLDIDGRTPLHRAVEGGHEAVATLLIGGFPEALCVQDKRGCSPLDVAKDDSMRALIARLVSPNSINSPSSKYTR